MNLRFSGCTLLTVISAVCVLTACDAPSSTQPAASTEPKKPNYARCAGSYEPEKCRAEEERLASETPAEAAARRKQLDEDRARSSKAVAAMPVPKPPSAAPEQTSSALPSTAIARPAPSPNKQAFIHPGGWICMQQSDAVQYSRLRRAGISTTYPGCAQATAPVLVMVLQRGELAGTPIVNVGMSAGNAWTIEEDLVAAE